VQLQWLPVITKPMLHSWYLKKYLYGTVQFSVEPLISWGPQKTKGEKDGERERREKEEVETKREERKGGRREGEGGGGREGKREKKKKEKETEDSHS